MNEMQPIPSSVLPSVAFVETFFLEPRTYRTVASAALIGPRLLLTAGHVVFDHFRQIPSINNARPFLTNRGEPHRIRVTFGNGLAPINASNWLSNTVWVNDHSRSGTVQRRIESSFDFGAIVLPRPVDLQVGGLFMVQTTPSSVNLPADVAGYSARHFIDFGSKQLFASAASDRRQFGNDRSLYSVDTFAGMSGGPIWTSASGSGRTIRGIHTSEFSATGPGSALNITDVVMRHINQWISETHPAVA